MKAIDIEERLARTIPFIALAIALITGGAWFGSIHAGPPQQPAPYVQPPSEPPPPQKTDCSGCADCANCDLSGCDGCDLSGCDVSGCDISIRTTLPKLGLLTLLLPLALLDMWRRRIARQERLASRNPSIAAAS